MADRGNDGNKLLCDNTDERRDCSFTDGVNCADRDPSLFNNIVLGCIGDIDKAKEICKQQSCKTTESILQKIKEL